jgi:hypothetical protein
VATPITEAEFRAIQSQLTVNDPVTVMILSGRCLAVVRKIAASKDFDEYKRIVRAEHPPVKHSLRDEIDDLKLRVDRLEDIVENHQTTLFPLEEPWA